MFYLAFLKPSGVAIASKNHHVHVALHAASLKSRNMFIETQKQSMVLNCAILKTEYYLFFYLEYIHIRI